MKILSCTFNFLSKFKTNSIISSCENLQHFRFKSVLWQKTYSTCIISVYRYLTVRNDTPRTENSFWKKGKFFQETENEYAHEVMKKLPKYSNSLLTNPLQDDILKSFFAENLNAIENFAKITVDNIGKGTNLGNLEFKIVIQNVCCSLSQATDEEIKMALRCLCMWPPGDNTLEANFVDLWNKLDRECVKRFKRWDIDQQLLIADYWFYLRLSRISNYNRERIFHKRQLSHEMNMSHENNHLVFVYGTLKNGEPNHDLIKSRTEGEAMFIGNAKTVKKWPLVIASRYNIPYVLYCEGRGKHVNGEIYEVDDVMLAKLDELECHPKYYTRQTVEVQMIPENGRELLKPWIYFLKNFRSELLDLPYLSNYSSKGAHGLEYVNRYYRPTGKSYYSEVMNL